MIFMGVSCIVPVYNEGERVLRVLDVLVGHAFIDEVIVIDDGSLDNSRAILEKKEGIHLIVHQKNKGKSFAVKSGIQEARNDIVMLIDSDLIGLDPGDITRLIEPVINGTAEISMSIRKNSLLIYKMFGIDFVSGERVFHKSIIEDLTQLERLPGFGLEVFLNRIIIARHLSLRVVSWPGVISPRKSKKFGWWRGLTSDYKMVMQIVSIIGYGGALAQILKMRALRI